MKKLLSTKYTYYDDFYENDNWKKYRAQGIDEKYVPNEEWISELGNEYYMIWAPQTNRRTKMEVAKCKISRGEYGEPKVYGKYLDKPFKNAGWDQYFPRYCWGDAYKFMGIPVTEDNRRDCLVFDNEQEAREFCDAYNKWKVEKNQRQIDEYYNREDVIQKYNEIYNKVMKCLDKLDNDTHNLTLIQDIESLLMKYKKI